jgi:hypothetical protein
LILGNPPWDTLSPDAKEFFAAYNAQIRVQDKDGQRAIIERLLEEPTIAIRWASCRRDLYSFVHFLKSSRRFTLYAPGNLGKGDFNVFRMFTETALDHVRPSGWSAQVVPDGLYGGANCMAIRKELFEKTQTYCIIGFANSGGVWFPDIHRSQKFCLYAARKAGSTDRFRAAFNIDSREGLAGAQDESALSIPVAFVRETSPEALAIAEVDNQFEVNIVTKMYSRWPRFGDASASGPVRHYMRELDVGNDRELFDEDPSGLPLYEGRMVSQYDHRAKGYRSGRGRRAVWEDLPFDDVSKSIQPQWHVQHTRVPSKLAGRIGHYRIGFCDVASPTNERSLVAAIIPPHTVCGDKVPTIMFRPNNMRCCLVWLATANSFCVDFLARSKISLKMSYTVLDSLPIPRLSDDDPLVAELTSRVLRLTCTGPEMIDLWNQMAAAGLVEPNDPKSDSPGVTDEQERLQLRVEIEAIVAHHLYGLTRDELAYILDTFPIVNRRDRESHGSPRTKEAVLAAYDARHQHENRNCERQLN